MRPVLNEFIGKLHITAGDNLVYDGNGHNGLKYDLAAFVSMTNSEAYSSITLTGTSCATNAGKYRLTFSFEDSLPITGGAREEYVGNISDMDSGELNGDEFRVDDDGNIYRFHQGSEETAFYTITTNIEWNILPKPLTKDLVRFSKDECTSIDDALAALSFSDTPPATITESDYRATCLREAYKGLLTVTITGTNNYTGSVSHVFRFSPASRATGIVLR